MAITGTKNLNLYLLSAMPNLYPFQTKAISEMLHFLRTNESHGVYNACEMGTGKTIMSIVATNKLNCQSLLVTCPASVLLNWKIELDMWSALKFNCLIVFGKRQLCEIPKLNYSCVIISHDMAKQPAAVRAITTRSWDMLICDESHRLKNRKSQRSMAILGPIWEKTKYRQALSGTPITDCVVDLYSLANKFLPSKFKNYYEFANTFAHQDVGPWATVYYGIKNAEVLKKIIRSTFFVRYTKEEAGLDLPPKVFQKVLLPDTYAFKVPVTEEEVLKAEVEALTLSIETGTKIPAVPKTIAGHRKAAAIKKLPAVIDFIENALEQEPVVVFGWHLDVIKNIASHFSAYNPSVITGETPPKDRQESVRRFQDGETKLFIGNMVAAGVGTTLTAASCVIMAELSWSPPDVAQSIDRLNRIGAKYTTSIYYFEVQGSIENRIIDAVVNKVKVFEKLMERSNA